MSATTTLTFMWWSDTNPGNFCQTLIYVCSAAPQWPQFPGYKISWHSLKRFFLPQDNHQDLEKGEKKEKELQKHKQSSSLCDAAAAPKCTTALSWELHSPSKLLSRRNILKTYRWKSFSYTIPVCPSPGYTSNPGNVFNITSCVLRPHEIELILLSKQI